jgi:hypothetical protein
VFVTAGFARVFREKRLELKSRQGQTKAEDEGPRDSKIILSPCEKAFPGTNRRLAVFKIIWRIVWGIFSRLVFLITLQKKKSPEPKYGLYRRVSTSATICDEN